MTQLNVAAYQIFAWMEIALMVDIRIRIKAGRG
jgi:hypothetical protein